MANNNVWFTLVFTLCNIFLEALTIEQYSRGFVSSQYNNIWPSYTKIDGVTYWHERGWTVLVIDEASGIVLDDYHIDLLSGTDSALVNYLSSIQQNRIVVITTQDTTSDQDSSNTGSTISVLNSWGCSSVTGSLPYRSAFIFRGKPSSTDNPSWSYCVMKPDMGTYILQSVDISLPTSAPTPAPTGDPTPAPTEDPTADPTAAPTEDPMDLQEGKVFEAATTDNNDENDTVNRMTDDESRWSGREPLLYALLIAIITIMFCCCITCIKVIVDFKKLDHTKRIERNVSVMSMSENTNAKHRLPQSGANLRNVPPLPHDVATEATDAKKVNWPVGDVQLASEVKAHHVDNVELQGMDIEDMFDDNLKIKEPTTNTGTNTTNTGTNTTNTGQ